MGCICDHGECIRGKAVSKSVPLRYLARLKAWLKARLRVGLKAHLKARCRLWGLRCEGGFRFAGRDLGLLVCFEFLFVVDEGDFSGDDGERHKEPEGFHDPNDEE